MHTGGSYQRYGQFSVSSSHGFFSVTYIPAFLARRITVFHLSLFSPPFSASRLSYRYYQYSNI